MRISSTQSELPSVLAAAERLQASLVGRAVLGLHWLTLARRSDDDALAAVEELRATLAPDACVVVDAPLELRRRLSPWGAVDDAELALMRRLKERFDPEGTCNPGVFVGGI